MESNFRYRTKKLIRFDDKYRKSFGNYICGIDEAGRGPLAGPVVASAVMFEKGVYIYGVFDSKQLTEAERELLFDEIKKNCVCFGIGIVRNIEIDKINILNATKEAMTKAIENMRYVPDLVLADGNFFKHKEIKVENIIKGDTLSFSIAAASVIAKVTRDRLMVKYENLYPDFSFAQHKGYPTKQHIEEIKLHGYTDIHRKSFVVKSLVQMEMFDEVI